MTENNGGLSDGQMSDILIELTTQCLGSVESQLGLSLDESLVQRITKMVRIQLFFFMKKLNGEQRQLLVDSVILAKRMRDAGMVPLQTQFQISLAEKMRDLFS